MFPDTKFQEKPKNAGATGIGAGNGYMGDNGSCRYCPKI